MLRWGYGSFAVLLACALGPAPARAATHDMSITQTKNTAHYRLTLQVGPIKTMYSKDDAAKMHPASGEIMVGGTMAMPGDTIATRRYQE